MQDSSSSGRAVVAVAVVVAGQRHTGRQRVAMLLQARSRLGELLAMATVTCPMHTKSKNRDRFIARPITAQCRPATAFSEARCHARAKFTTTSPQAGASNTPEHPSATLRDKCYRVQNSPNELGRIRLSTKELEADARHIKVLFVQRRAQCCQFPKLSHIARASSGPTRNYSNH